DAQPAAQRVRLHPGPGPRAPGGDRRDAAAGSAHLLALRRAGVALLDLAAERAGAGPGRVPDATLPGLGTGGLRAVYRAVLQGSAAQRPALPGFPCEPGSGYAPGGETAPKSRRGAPGRRGRPLLHSRSVESFRGVSDPADP